MAIQKFKKLTQLSNMYFEAYDETKKPSFDSKKAAENLKSMLPCKEAKFIGWDGLNDDIVMRYAADNIFKKISADVESWRDDNKDNKDKKYPLPINLIGHSHGGNVMIMVANKLYRKKDEAKGKFPVFIANIITLNAPVREYQLEYPINHIQTFSRNDNVQAIGSIDPSQYIELSEGKADIDFSLLDEFLSKKGKNVGHEFLFAKNIDVKDIEGIEDFLSFNSYNEFREKLQPQFNAYSETRFVFDQPLVAPLEKDHQITRKIYETIKFLIDKKYLYY